MRASMPLNFDMKLDASIEPLSRCCCCCWRCTEIEHQPLPACLGQHNLEITPHWRLLENIAPIPPPPAGPIKAMLQSTVVLRRALARARRPAIVAGASPSSCCLPEALLLQGPRRFLMSSSAPPPQPKGEQPSGAGAGGKPAEPLSEKEAARLKKIAKIKEEIRRGYFYELGEMNRTKGKVCGCVFGQ